MEFVEEDCSVSTSVNIKEKELKGSEMNHEVSLSTPPHLRSGEGNGYGVDEDDTVDSSVYEVDAGDERVEYVPYPDVFEKLFAEETVADASLKYGNAGETRRQIVERKRQEKEREKEESLRFRPQLVARSPTKRSSTNSGHKREKYVDKELTFSPQITDKWKYIKRSNSKENSSASSSPQKDKIKTKSNVESKFSPDGTSNSSSSKNKGKISSTKKREKTKEEQECTFAPVFESRKSYKQVQTKIKAEVDEPSGKRVLVIGSTNMDLISYVDEHPPIGATITGNSFEKNYGGKGANQAVMVAHLCRPTGAARRSKSTGVSFLTKMGKDVYGKDYISYLRAEKGFYSTEGLLCCENSATGLALITVDRAGRNTIILQPGANIEITPADVSTFLRSQAKHSNVLVCQNEITHSATLQALAEVSCMDHMVSILNPAPISSKKDDMFELLRYADIICPNEVELSMLAKMPVTNVDEAVTAGRRVLAECRNLRKLVHFMCQQDSTASGRNTVDDMVQIREEDAAAAARRPQVLVVTMGSQGVCIVSDSGSDMIPAPRVNAIDTVGAGDCFIGTLAYHISNGLNLRKSVIYAVECASISVTRKGAQTSYPERSELNYSHI